MKNIIYSSLLGALICTFTFYVFYMDYKDRQKLHAAQSCRHKSVIFEASGNIDSASYYAHQADSLINEAYHPKSVDYKK